MKKSLDQGNLREALKFSSTMLSEMKTSKLTPATISICVRKSMRASTYSLDMMVFDELALLE